MGSGPKKDNTSFLSWAIGFVLRLGSTILTGSSSASRGCECHDALTLNTAITFISCVSCECCRLVFWQDGLLDKCNTDVLITEHFLELYFFVLQSCDVDLLDVEIPPSILVARCR